MVKDADLLQPGRRKNTLPFLIESSLRGFPITFQKGIQLARNRPKSQIKKHEKKKKKRSETLGVRGKNARAKPSQATGSDGQEATKDQKKKSKKEQSAH